MNRLALVFLPLLLLLSHGVSAEETRAKPGSLEAYRSLLIERTNVLRFGKGRVSIEASPGLDRVAQAHAEDMLRRGYFAHESPDGERARDRVARIIPEMIVFDVRENLARTTATNPSPMEESVEDAMTGWVKSPPHAKNLFHSGTTHVGFGVAEVTRNGVWEQCIVMVSGVYAGEWEGAPPSLASEKAGDWGARLRIPIEFSLRALDQPNGTFPDPVIKGVSWVGAFPLDTTANRGKLRVRYPALAPGRYELVARRMGDHEWWQLGVVLRAARAKDEG
jgi:uncharacterized protein YkwD